MALVVCHCHPKYELFSPEIGIVALCQDKIDCTAKYLNIFLFSSRLVVPLKTQELGCDPEPKVDARR